MVSVKASIQSKLTKKKIVNYYISVASYKIQ
jgi:hypothetical protein